VRVDCVGGGFNPGQSTPPYRRATSLRWSVFIDPSGPSKSADTPHSTNVIRAWHLNFLSRTAAHDSRAVFAQQPARHHRNFFNDSASTRSKYKPMFIDSEEPTFALPCRLAFR
jgi:hypothetical protein